MQQIPKEKSSQAGGWVPVSPAKPAPDPDPGAGAQGLFLVTLSEAKGLWAVAEILRSAQNDKVDGGDFGKALGEGDPVDLTKCARMKPRSS